jgi:hypothetical protein
MSQNVYCFVYWESVKREGHKKKGVPVLEPRKDGKEKTNENMQAQNQIQSATIHHVRPWKVYEHIPPKAKVHHCSVQPPCVGEKERSGVT